MAGGEGATAAAAPPLSLPAPRSGQRRESDSGSADGDGGMDAGDGYEEAALIPSLSQIQPLRGEAAAATAPPLSVPRSGRRGGGERRQRRGRGDGGADAGDGCADAGDGCAEAAPLPSLSQIRPLRGEGRTVSVADTTLPPRSDPSSEYVLRGDVWCTIAKLLILDLKV
uniref:Uncharacterized protein n=1 Tax=Oryza sativa subsp. japonica TaxID=39947 RepID=Q5Z7S3_ORYSJ|nr:hypothetical protein [Oryza sativa Japonica Group]BAD61783.1 hypothetical protein [Oryza sativa Japonica Group]